MWSQWGVKDRSFDWIIIVDEWGRIQEFILDLGDGEIVPGYYPHRRGQYFTSTMIDLRWQIKK